MKPGQCGTHHVRSHSIAWHPNGVCHTHRQLPLEIQAFPETARPPLIQRSADMTLLGLPACLAAPEGASHSQPLSPESGLPTLAPDYCKLILNLPGGSWRVTPCCARLAPAPMSFPVWQAADRCCCFVPPPEGGLPHAHRGTCTNWSQICLLAWRQLRIDILSVWYILMATSRPLCLSWAQATLLLCPSPTIFFTSRSANFLRPCARVEVRAQREASSEVSILQLAASLQGQGCTPCFPQQPAFVPICSSISGISCSCAPPPPLPHHHLPVENCRLPAKSERLRRQQPCLDAGLSAHARGVLRAMIADSAAQLERSRRGTVQAGSGDNLSPARRLC